MLGFEEIYLPALRPNIGEGSFTFQPTCTFLQFPSDEWFPWSDQVGSQLVKSFDVREGKRGGGEESFNWAVTDRLQGEYAPDRCLESCELLEIPFEPCSQLNGSLEFFVAHESIRAIITEECVCIY